MKVAAIPRWLVAVVLAVVFAFTAAAVIAFVIGGPSSDTTPVLTTVLGFAGTIITALLALLKAEQAAQRTEAVNAKVNGHISRLTDAAINAGVKPEDLPPAPPDMPAKPGQAGGNGQAAP